MLDKYVKRFNDRKQQLRESFKEDEPSSYQDIVARLVQTISDDDSGGYGEPDASRMEVIDHGHYQGTRLFLFPEGGYQPSTYFVIKEFYGSCSGCDTFLSIQSSSYFSEEEAPTESQLDDYMKLALHMIQSMKKI